MKIGDKVNFLRETGGGKVAGFQGKNIVLVEDEDGFQIPMPVNEVVIVDSDDYSTASVINKRAEADERKAEETPLQRGGRSVSAMMRDGQEETVDMTVEDVIDDTKEVTFRPQAEERKGGNQLTALLAFVPANGHVLADPHLDLYFVNDSNYYMQYTFLVAEGNSWTVQARGEVAPNTKLFIEEVGREQINHLDRVAVQLIAYKHDKPFILKPAVDVQMRIDPMKFYKQHAFEDNDFFEQPALLYTIIENDQPLRPLVADAKAIKREMYKSNKEQADTHLSSRRDQLVRRYSDDQLKGNKRHSSYIRHSGLDDAIVVDLHADEILDTTQGMSAGEILEYQLKIFRETLDAHAAHKGQKLIFIHGKGEGVLRRALINELNYKYKSYTYQDASFQEYGYGATQVVVR